ncbi:hypothetical protein GCM10007418_24850 [Halopseudomonas salina]|uniref:Uncharacterized protein n=1 Tax=Halopseudomonas salina TaxID=1323744 RepID=A0ABQ1PVL0_9GAMM|nr:hypothetical protein GCM10007418_24850 [Halopseudomonas salina]
MGDQSNIYMVQLAKTGIQHLGMCIQVVHVHLEENHRAGTPDIKVVLNLLKLFFVPADKKESVPLLRPTPSTSDGDGRRGP